MGVAARMIGDRAESEDLAQDVFVKVFRSLRDFDGRSLFSTWLYRIAANNCLNHRAIALGRPDRSFPDMP
jgi:RNA polymerase sigma-70 factor (ECF subfamily)